MDRIMRTKMNVTEVHLAQNAGETEVLKMMCVVGGNAPPFGPNGESEDNTFARYTPFGTCVLHISNPELQGRFVAGQTFYVDFTPTGTQHV